MTREQAKKNLVALGISEPTEEQISNYLNAVNGEVQKEKDNSKKYKEDAEKLSEVQKELDDLKSANLSDIEKANKSLEEANNKIAELERKDAVRAKRANAISKWKITSEQAEKIYSDDGTFDDDLLGQIISEKETAAATAKEQEIANNSSNPNGGSASGNNENLTKAEKLAKGFFGGTEKKDSVISHYLNN